MSEQILNGPWVRSYHGFQVLTRDGMVSICELNGRLDRDTQIAVAELIRSAPTLRAQLAAANQRIKRLEAEKQEALALLRDAGLPIADIEVEIIERDNDE